MNAVSVSGIPLRHPVASRTLQPLTPLNAIRAVVVGGSAISRSALAAFESQDYFTLSEPLRFQAAASSGLGPMREVHHAKACARGDCRVDVRHSRCGNAQATGAQGGSRADC